MFSRNRSYIYVKEQVLIKLRAEVQPSIFSNHNGIKHEHNDKNKNGKVMNIWKLNNKLLNNQWVKD